MKRSRLKRGSNAGNKSRLERLAIRRIHDYDGKLIGSIEITHAVFEETEMHGVYHHPKGDLMFSGYWDEGFFNIENVKGVQIVGDALSELEQEITDHYKNIYTDTEGNPVW